MASEEVIPVVGISQGANTPGRRLTVVCPVYNEEGSAGEFYSRLSAALGSIQPFLAWDVILVNDGSTDATAQILEDLAAKDSRVGVIEFSRNFGHQLAITAGIDHATGDAVVVIDSDLQDPPEAIVGMVELWRAGYDVVYGQRSIRPGESRFKLATAHVFYRMINWMSDVSLPADAGDFRLMSRRVVEALHGIREESRYVRGLVAWVGFRQTALSYERDERFAGETKYPLRKMLKFATDGISSFSEKPLRVATQMGMVATAVAFIVGVYIVILKIIESDSSLPGYASMMAVILFLGGIQLLSIGILGQYIGRIYREVKRRPLYIVAEANNIERVTETPAPIDARTPEKPTEAYLQS